MGCVAFPLYVMSITCPLLSSQGALPVPLCSDRPSARLPGVRRAFLRFASRLPGPRRVGLASFAPGPFVPWALAKLSVRSLAVRPAGCAGVRSVCPVRPAAPLRCGALLRWVEHWQTTAAVCVCVGSMQTDIWVHKGSRSVRVMWSGDVLTCGYVTLVTRR